MSLFTWFARKPAGKATAAAQSSGLAHIDATVPFNNAGNPNRRDRAVSSNAANRKSERLERRELLYSVVRDGMTRAGVLSASYKFKVLSLDSRGSQYLIMMDLTRKDTASPERLAEIEGLIAQSAKTRHAILITAVYWRINEHVTAGLTANSSPAPLAPTLPRVVTAKPRFDPLHSDEVAAFKMAISAAAMPVPLSAPGEIIRSGRRNPLPEAQEEFDVERRASPLSGTQYGDLN